VKEFGEHVMPEGYRHLFLVSGGALAVENALKASFDWKVRWNQARGIGEEVGSQVIHLREAFHGRSGYTLSLTNTADPRKTMYYPKFRWPRVLNPKIRFPLGGENLAATVQDEETSIAEVEAAFARHGADVAAVILEPIQCEGGDNHFRADYLRRLREICDREEAMLIFDEVQTGYFATGKPWCFQQLGVAPDMVAFAKKTQVSGFFANSRIDCVERNVFVESSRINSTWGGSLADMTRSKWIRRAIHEDRMAENAAAMGDLLVARLAELGSRLGGGWVSNARGRGTIVAFDCPSKTGRDALLKSCFGKRLLALGCGERSVRFRPPLNVSKPEVDQAVERLNAALSALGVRPGASAPVPDPMTLARIQAASPGDALENAK
jgi:L-lysine 6-transaminase